MLNYQFSMFKLLTVVDSNVAIVWFIYACPKHLSLGLPQTLLTSI